MQKRTREIIALILLIVLAIAGVGAFSWYILVGHNWNEAASNIDDHVGDMGGYTVVLYEGVVPTEVAQYEMSISQPMLEEQNYGELGIEGQDASAFVPVQLADAVESYRGKDAHVLTIDASDLRAYEDPVITVRDGKRIAIYSVKGPRPDLASRIMLKELQRYDIDFTICITDSQEAVDDGLGSVNVAICTDYEDVGVKGHYIGVTYSVGSPYLGQVQAVIIAPSGFLSSKVVSL